MWSEFGRRPQENGGGTDHGAAGLAFLVGKHAGGTMIGGFPGLTSLDPQDNLVHTSDFRTMYCTLLHDWLGVDPGPIIPGADPHNLVVDRQGTVALSFPTLAPGGDQRQTLTLKRGTYTLYCSLLNHKDLGMQATLTVN